MFITTFLNEIKTTARGRGEGEEKMTFMLNSVEKRTEALSLLLVVDFYTHFLVSSFLFLL
jgi:hypothetical protein